MNERLILSLDQGTTSTRALLIDEAGAVRASEGLELTQFFPADGWVEHDPEEVLNAAGACAKSVMARKRKAGIVAIGITNQRETTVLWDRTTGKALHRAIVWQDRRTAGMCERLKAEGREPAIQERTGLLLDPYFSGTKLAWLLDHMPGARTRAERGELAFGTIDSWLIFRLTGGRVHATDATNASRTMLYDIRRGDWDEDILRWLNIPRALLPEVKDCAADFGTSDRAVLDAAIPILGVAGDQQAATVGQACFAPGEIKSTYGTGCFLLVNTGDTPPRSKARLLGTIAYRLGGKTTYALEGSIFMAGAIVEWLKSLGLIARAQEIDALAARANPASRCILVPGFVGLGAPYWAPNARGALLGMTRDTGAPEIAAAALDAVALQTRDLLEAVQADTGVAPSSLRVDGGLTRSDFFLQRLADLTGAEVVRSATTETTAVGAAFLAGLKAGVFKDLGAIAVLRRDQASFTPRLPAAEREIQYAAWRAAVARTL
ncbi:MAG: glycerol kinase GlpK [Alphaproteobacteria bacterium]